jgi:hypothetical protein
MSFVAKVNVTKCAECPYKEAEDSFGIPIYTCSELKSNPVIEYNGILQDCPHNKRKELIPIPDYVKERNNDVRK